MAEKMLQAKKEEKLKINIVFNKFIFKFIKLKIIPLISFNEKNTK